MHGQQLGEAGTESLGYAKYHQYLWFQVLACYSILCHPPNGDVFCKWCGCFLKWCYPTNPWVFLLKRGILGWRLGVPPFKETPMYCFLSAFCPTIEVLLTFLLSRVELGNSLGPSKTWQKKVGLLQKSAKRKPVGMLGFPRIFVRVSWCFVHPKSVLRQIFFHQHQSLPTVFGPGRVEVVVLLDKRNNRVC